MVIILENSATDQQIENVIKHLEDYGFAVHKSTGVERTVLGAVGVQPDFDTRKVRILDGVADVYRITTPYKMASRNFAARDTVIKFKGTEIGGNAIAMIAGPCSVESEEQMFLLAEIVAKSGAKFLRGGAFKPRTSPYSFQGMGEEGLKIMRAAADKYNLLVVTEVMQIDQIDLIYKYTDIYQVGAQKYAELFNDKRTW